MQMKPFRVIFEKLFVVLMGIVWSAPILWVVTCSFKGQLLGGIPESLTTDWALTNFLNLGRYSFMTGLANSIIVALLSSTIGTAVGLVLSFGLICRSKPFFRPLLLILSGRTLPLVLFLLPQYLIARRLGVAESRLTLSLFHAFGSLSIALFLLCPPLLHLHAKFFDQARMDSASDATYFLKVLTPQLFGPIAFCMAVSMMLSWTDYLFASIFVVNEDVRTLPVLIGNFITSYGTSWGPMYASLTLSFFVTVVLTGCAGFIGSTLLRRHD